MNRLVGDRRVMVATETEETQSTVRSPVAGVILVLVAAILWSLNGALIKLIGEGDRGPHFVTIAFYRSLFAGLFLIPFAHGKFHTLKRDRNKPLPRGRPSPRAFSIATVLSPLAFRPAALCSVLFFTLMTVCFVGANTKTEAANAIILQYTSTFWIFALSPWLLHEKPRRKDLWILGLALIGIAIIFAGNFETGLVGLVIGLASGLFFGLLTLMIRRMRDSDSAAVAAFNSLGSAALLLPVYLLVDDFALTPKVWLLLIGMGVVQFAVPYYLYTLGLARIRAYQAALITLVEPVLNPIWTYLAVGERVPVATAIGGGVILAALFLFVRTARATRDGVQRNAQSTSGGRSPRP